MGLPAIQAPEAHDRSIQTASKASSAMIAAISAPAPYVGLSSYTTRHLPVFRAERTMVAVEGPKDVTSTLDRWSLRA